MKAADDPYGISAANTLPCFLFYILQACPDNLI